MHTVVTPVIVLLLLKGDINGFLKYFSFQEVDWWEDILDRKIYNEADYSGKMVLLLDILSLSSEAGDKALVFSQSLTTLDMIELFLSRLPRKGSEDKCWKQGKDWYRYVHIVG